MLKNTTWINYSRKGILKINLSILRKFLKSPLPQIRWTIYGCGEDRAASVL